MGVPDWRNIAVENGIVREPTPDANRIAIWLPLERVNGSQEWQRVASQPHSEFAVEPGISAAAATAIRARQASRGLLGKLLGGLRRSGDHSWLLPNGDPAEQLGERENDLLFVWADNGERPLDPTWIQSRWPQSKRIRKVSENLFLVSGVEPPSGKTEPESQQECARAIAERLLAAAKAKGDRAAESSALADLGAAYLHEGNGEKAVAALGEGLKIARELGDRDREGDILGNFGLVTMAAGHPARALEIFTQELAQARSSADRFGEKTALERIGLAHVKLNDPIRALEAFEQALALARALGHRKHQSDLLWSAAIQYAELGRRNEAIEYGQAAIEIMQKMRNPQAAWFTEHLEKFRRGESSDGLVSNESSLASTWPGAFLGGSVVAGMWAPTGNHPGQPPNTEGPGVLRMAVSAARSMAKFIGSGFKTVPQQIRQQRLRTCAACEHHTGARCRLCGCFTNAKTRLEHEECPIGKWTAYVR
jgi:tetratricopeptide (TPR) repeat protein